MSQLFYRWLSRCLALSFLALLISQQSSWAGRPSQGCQRQQYHEGGGWSEWSGWSVCSRTCGGGASTRTRASLSRKPLEILCAGETRQYKICNIQVVLTCEVKWRGPRLCGEDCATGSVTFQELQCAAFNDRPVVAGAHHRWAPFHGGPNPCELSCIALGHNFYYNFGRVLDGTSCNTEPKGVCVNGLCLKPGCDLILGSEKQEDACMVCGGRNATCLHHQSVYQSSGHGNEGPFGYNEITVIPSGATSIRVTDNSRNYLALQNSRAQFLINGNWRISMPGEYSVAGTKLVYRRSTDTWESFEVQGPTQEDLHIMVLSTDRDSGVVYEYWLPPDRYHGRRSQLSPPHHAANFSPWQPTTTTVTMTTRTTAKPPVTALGGSWPSRPPRQHPLPRLERDKNRRNLLPAPPRQVHCGQCRRVRGHGERQRQYCQRDFVFRAKVLAKLYLGEETRYDVQVVHTYRNHFRLEHREFIWVPNVCDCPPLEEGHQYVLMARRHINHEHTLNRILLEKDSYTQPFRPREDSLLRPLEALCGHTGSR